MSNYVTLQYYPTRTPLNPSCVLAVNRSTITDALKRQYGIELHKSTAINTLFYYRCTNLARESYNNNNNHRFVKYIDGFRVACSLYSFFLHFKATQDIIKTILLKMVDKSS